ncbi:MAG: DNA-binding transcriptional ArsR family regulator/uncharacterized protein YndB with AHSA1 [Myxococcota bacterium]|jgi:DNA-binding transcriptional ArsR family regulator/uncharacterized protein YndB with AHSA1/START domain
MESEAETRVWKAMGDPSRRRILELLKAGPRTTGELCSAFEMSRYGVMKHMTVLEEAGLLSVQREGRTRFNHLNAVPLQRVHRRFVDRISERHATSLLDLGLHLDRSGATDSRFQRSVLKSQHPKERDASMTTPTATSAVQATFHILQENDYAATPDAVWGALTRDIGKWWGFHIGPDDSAITMDAHVGGQFIERWGDGEGELYATITFLKKGAKITLEGGMGMSGPGYSKFSFSLAPVGEGTRLTLNHYCHGQQTDTVEASFAEGWRELLGKHLRAWLEDGKAA